MEVFVVRCRLLLCLGLLNGKFLLLFIENMN
jgi:hypothetical protein